MGGVSVFMIRPGVIVVAIAVVAGVVGVVEAVGERYQTVARAAERAAFSETCEHYRARVRAGPARRAMTGDFVVFLAGTCGAAEVSLETGTRNQKARAALLLSRIVLLRETVGRMNAERAARAAARANPSGGAGLPTLYRVTPSGEFLIAHRMGLMIAYDAWLDTGVDFSLASYR